MKPFQTLVSLITCVALGATQATAQWSTDSLSVPRSDLVAATVGDLSLFAGGGTGGVGTVSERVDIYDATTDSWLPTEQLSQGRFGMGVTVLGDLVFFAGGNSGGARVDRVDVFDNSTGLWSTAKPLSEPRAFLAATSVGSKAFFVGGADGPVFSDVVDIYDASMGLPDDPVAWSTTTLSVARRGLAATTAGGQALFAGGFDSFSAFDVVDVYDDATGSWLTPMHLSLARPLSYGAALSVGSIAVFAGGQASPFPAFSFTDVVDIYDAQTEIWSTTTMSLARGELALAAVGDTVLFAGGVTDEDSIYTPTDVVEQYDVVTKQWGPIGHLSEARHHLAATTTSDGQAIFGGGGLTIQQSSDTVDVFEPGAWTNLGGSSPGIAGNYPWLNGNGDLVGGTPASVSLSHAAQSALALVWISFAPTPFAALEGTVHAFPYANQLLLGTNAAGQVGGATTWPLGLPSGTNAWFQFFIADATSAHGITLSNGLLATTP